MDTWEIDPHQLLYLCTVSPFRLFPCSELSSLLQLLLASFTLNDQDLINQALAVRLRFFKTDDEPVSKAPFNFLHSRKRRLVAGDGWEEGNAVTTEVFCRQEEQRAVWK